MTNFFAASHLSNIKIDRRSIIRSLPQKMLRFIRFNSISTIKNQLINGEVPITKQLIEKSVKNDELPQLKAILKQNSGLLTPLVKNDLINYIPQDFSIYYLLKDQEHHWTSTQIASLIKSNPERVDTSWELYLRHGPQSQALTQTDANIQDEVYKTLIEKLLIEPSDSDWAKILYGYRKLQDKGLVQESIFAKLVEQNSTNLAFFDFPYEFLLIKVNGLSESQFSVVFQKLFQDDPEKLPYDIYIKAINSFKSIKPNTEFISTFRQITNEKEDITYNELEITDILSYIEDKGLDINDNVPESLLLRLKIIEIYGMELNDFDKLLKKYHQYQTRSKFGFELIQNLLIQCYCLKSFDESNKEILPLINALMLENVPIKVIQCLILTNSAFGTDTSLEIYNKYIGHVSNTPNEFTNRSPAGLLNESIMLAFLYNNDREFASIIFDKLAANKALPEHELSILKKLFKVYGDVFIEDSWETARPKLKQYISNTIKKL